MKKGELILRSSGEYSDYSVHGVFRLLKDGQISEDADFEELLKKGMVEEVGYTEMWSRWGSKTIGFVTEHRLSE